MEAPEFSVIIPTYGRPQYLADAIESVLAQTLDDFEVIVVDDHTAEPVVLPIQDARIQLIRRPNNAGPAAARNDGITEARGMYLTFLDDDDSWLPKRLEYAREGLARAPLAVCWSDSPGRVLNGMVAGELLAGTTPHLGTTAIVRAFAEPFDESYAAVEDVEWWLRMACQHAVATVPEVGHRFRRHDEVRGSHGTAARVTASQKLLHEHPAFFAAHPAAAAFRWKRIGLMSAALGDRQAARAAYLKALRIKPTAAVAKHLARTWVR